MIAKLRRRHRVTFPILGLLIAVITVFALQQKPDVSNNTLPGYSKTIPTDLIESSGITVTWDNEPMKSIVLYSASEQAYYIKFLSYEEVSGPDLLLYVNEHSSKEISDSSKLVGRFIFDNPAYYKLLVSPENASVILYSLPKKEVLAAGTMSVREDSK